MFGSIIRGWRKKYDRGGTEPGRIVLIKVQSAQSPLAVLCGYEEEYRSHYWHCGHTGKLYERRGEDFIYIPTKSLSELITELNTQG